MTPYLVHSKTVKTYQLFTVRHFTISCEILAQFKFDGKSRDSGIKRLKIVSDSNEKQLKEHFGINEVNLERLSFSRVKVNRGSPVCEKLSQKL